MEEYEALFIVGWGWLGIMPNLCIFSNSSRGGSWQTIKPPPTLVHFQAYRQIKMANRKSIQIHCKVPIETKVAMTMVFNELHNVWPSMYVLLMIFVPWGLRQSSRIVIQKPAQSSLPKKVIKQIKRKLGQGQMEIQNISHGQNLSRIKLLLNYQ